MSVIGLLPPAMVPPKVGICCAVAERERGDVDEAAVGDELAGRGASGGEAGKLRVEPSQIQNASGAAAADGERSSFRQRAGVSQSQRAGADGRAAGVSMLHRSA